MKNKMKGILAVFLTLSLISTMLFAAVPISAAVPPTGPGTNAWGDVGMPAIAPETEVGVMAIAPDGTIYAAIFYESDYVVEAKRGTWDIMKSTDGGFNWTATKLTGLVDDGDFLSWPTGVGNQTPVDIAISQNWENDQTLYVACLNGDIYRLEEAGAATPILLKAIVDSSGRTLASGGFLYDIDLWFDGSDNWIMVACDMDVLVLRDALFENWRDQELATGVEMGMAVQANFAPDFSTSNLIWAVAANGIGYGLISIGDGLAEWSNENALSGSYSVKLDDGPADWTDWAGVRIPYGQTLDTFFTTGSDDTALLDFAKTYFWYNMENGVFGQIPVFTFVFEDEGTNNDETWKLVIGGPNFETKTGVGTWEAVIHPASNTIHLGGYTSPGVWEDYLIGGTWGAHTGNRIFEEFGWWQNNAASPIKGLTVDYVEVSIDTKEAIVYLDNITVNGVFYDLEPSFHLTSTISPGQWGNTIKDVAFGNQSGVANNWTPFVDIAFPDNYTTSAPMLYVAIAEGYFGPPDAGNLYMVQGAYASSTALTEADPLLPDDTDVGSVEVSGNVILLVDTWTGDVLVSKNAGDTFALATRGPSGPDSYWGHVYMALGAFDPDEGIAYFSSIDSEFGIDSALSRTTDGGATWDQISWIDTLIDKILDVAFAPEGASQPALLLTSETGGAESLWQTADATASSPQWIRVATNHNLEVNSMYYVEYSLDGSAIMLFVDGASFEIYKSTDDANTFKHWRDLPTDMNSINDWVIADSTTIYTATDVGYWGTSAFGPATIELLGALNSVAVNGDIIVVGTVGGDAYVSDDAGENWSASHVVSATGNVFVTFGADGTVYAVAADGGSVMHANVGVNALGQLALIHYDPIAKKDVVGFTALLDEDEDAATALGGFTGLWVAPDNTLYALGTSGTVASTSVTFADPTVFVDDYVLTIDTNSTLVLDGVLITVESGTFTADEEVDIFANTILAVTPSVAQGTLYVQGQTAGDIGSIEVTIINETGMAWAVDSGFSGITLTDPTLVAIGPSIGNDAQVYRMFPERYHTYWETVGIPNADGLWGTSGSNILWTIVPVVGVSGVSEGISALEDTLSGYVSGVAVAATTSSATVTWDAMPGAEGYKVMIIKASYAMAGQLSLMDCKPTTKTTYTFSLLDDDTAYFVNVMAVSPLSSRVDMGCLMFTTGDAVGVPIAEVPILGSQDYTLFPSFVWSAVSDADSYELELATAPDFSDAVVVLTTLTQHTWTTELEYDQNYYWRVRALSDVGGVSLWDVSNFHTKAEAADPVVVDVNPTPNITLTVPAAVTPSYIWGIIVIGALLTIAVIVLIVRTRRVV